MPLINRIFILIFLLVIIFRIEEFPFSNYQMYSKKIPMADSENYAYYQLRGVLSNSVEERIINRNFNLFHGEQPLMESIHKNHLSGKDLQSLLKGLYFHPYINQKYSKIRLYKVFYNLNHIKRDIISSSKSVKIKSHNSLFLAEYPIYE